MSSNIHKYHPHFFLLHSIFLSLLSYFNIMVYISQKQELHHTNTTYIIVIYISIILSILDIIICSLINLSSFVIYNFLYISCLVNLVFTHGNLLSVIIFFIESGNVSIDWILLVLFHNSDNKQIIYMKYIILFVYTICIKLILSPLLMIFMFYNLSKNYSEQLIIIYFCLYTANIIRLINQIFNIIVSDKFKYIYEKMIS